MGGPNTGPLCFPEFHFSSCKRLGAVIPLPSLQGHSDSHDIMLLLLPLKLSVSHARRPKYDVMNLMSATYWLSCQDLGSLLSKNFTGQDFVSVTDFSAVVLHQSLLLLEGKYYICVFGLFGLKWNASTHFTICV